MIDYLRKLFTFDAWANERVHAALANGPDDERALGLFAHVCMSQLIWMMRIRGENTVGMSTQVQLPLEESHALAERMRREWESLLEKTTEEELAGMIPYRSLTGDPFETPLADILIHVINHSTYHRGQIASALKLAGGTPAPTDYILFTRG